MNNKFIHQSKEYQKGMAKIEKNVTFCKLLELMPEDPNKVLKIVKMSLTER